MYAASFSDSATSAAMNGLNQPSANTGHSSGSAFQMNRSWRSVGVARKIQL